MSIHDGDLTCSAKQSRIRSIKKNVTMFIIKNGDLVAEETKHTVHWNLTKASKVMVIDEEGDLSEPVPFAQYLKKATHITEIKGKGMLKDGEIPKAKSKMFWSPPDKDTQNILMACKDSALFTIHFVVPGFPLPRPDADSDSPVGSLFPVGAVIKMAKRWTMPKGLKSAKMREPEKKPRAKAKAKAKRQSEFKDGLRCCCIKSRPHTPMTNTVAALHRTETERTEMNQKPSLESS